MPCGCTDYEIFILEKLYRGHKFGRNATYQIKKLQNAFRLEFAKIRGSDKRFHESIKRLLNHGVVAQLPKKGKMRFWLPDMGRAKGYLLLHGKNV